MDHYTRVNEFGECEEGMGDRTIEVKEAKLCIEQIKESISFEVVPFVSDRPYQGCEIFFTNNSTGEKIWISHLYEVDLDAQKVKSTQEEKAAGLGDTTTLEKREERCNRALKAKQQKW